MNKKLLMLLSSATLLFTFEKASASGFYLIEQSVSAMGTAYASGSAYAEDASTIWFNPAGLTSICGTQFVGGVHGVIPVTDFNDEGSQAIATFTTNPTPPPAGGVPDILQPLGSYQGQGLADGGNGGEWALVPQTYFSKQINNCMWFGIGITSPYGLVTDYDDNWRGRYHAIRSSVLTININPSFAWKINDKWSIGAGFSAMYLHAKLTNAVDFGLIGAYNLGASNAETLGLFPQQSDGRVEIKGNSWGYGGNAGITYEPCCGTRFGFNFRSEMKHNIKGQEKFKELPPGMEVSPAVNPLVAAFQNTGVQTDITLPMQLSASAYHEFNRCFAIMGDVTWTKWSSLQELVFEFDNPNQPDNVTTFAWDDSFRFSVGVHYRPNESLIARLGFSYDQTPVPNKEQIPVRVPDSDRFWLATGLGYNINRCTRIDIGYAHLFVKDAPVDKLTDLRTNSEDWYKGGLLGEYNAKVDIVSAQVVMNF